jgi:hypothetical protein
MARASPACARIPTSTRSSLSTTARRTRPPRSRERAGVRALAGATLSAGWRGKAWALEQGLRDLGRDRRLRRRPAPRAPRPGLARELEVFLATSPVTARWSQLGCERWDARLQCLRSTRAWDGRDPLAGAVGGTADGGPVAILTRATIRRGACCASIARSSRPLRSSREARPAGVGRRRRVAGRAPGDVLRVAVARRCSCVRPRDVGAPRGRASHARRGLVLGGALRALPALRIDRHMERHRPLAGVAADLNPSQR